MFDRRLMTGAGPLRLKWILLGWLVAELAVFALFVRMLGLGTTILLGLATSVLGIVTLRRVGLQALFGLRGALDGQPPPEGAMLEGLLGGLGALLLIVPGFIANLAGLALAAPSVRRRIMGLSGGDPGRGRSRLSKTSPDVLDLGPTDWRVVDRP